MGERRPRFLTQAYIVEIAYIERIQEELALLANDALTPLPQRLRRRCDAMRVRLEAIKRELETRPQAIAEERAREERRGPTP